MKVRIEVQEDLQEDEVVIYCGRVNDRIQKIQQLVQQQVATAERLTFYKDKVEFYFSVDQVLFFETQDDHVFAHTPSDVFRMKLRLYELEDKLPKSFVRVSKCAIVNTRHIYAISRNLTSSSQIQFKGSHKHVFVSRHFFHMLKERLTERNQYEK